MYMPKLITLETTPEMRRMRIELLEKDIIRLKKEIKEYKEVIRKDKEILKNTPKDQNIKEYSERPIKIVPC